MAIFSSIFNSEAWTGQKRKPMKKKEPKVPDYTQSTYPKIIKPMIATEISERELIKRAKELQEMWEAVSSDKTEEILRELDKERGKSLRKLEEEKKRAVKVKAKKETTTKKSKLNIPY
jgi:protein tyrosine/serine phosphatase